MQETQTLQQVSFAQETLKADQRNKKYDKPHMIIPDEDMAWALEQRSPVFKLWAQCWRSDPYGSRWMPLNTTLGRENFKKAKRPLIESGLFLFENRLTVVNGKRIYEWWIKNLHGCRSAYWKLKGIEVGTEDIEVGNSNTSQGINAGVNNTDVGANNTDAGASNTNTGVNNTPIGTINTTQPYLNSLAVRVSESLINASVTLHKHFNISLTISERGGFLEFCLEKINVLREKGFDVHTDYGWIASHYEQYWEEFRKSQATENQLETSQDKQNEILDRRTQSQEFLSRRTKDLDSDQNSAPPREKSATELPNSAETSKSLDQPEERLEESKRGANSTGVDRELVDKLKKKAREKRGFGFRNKKT